MNHQDLLNIRELALAILNITENIQNCGTLTGLTHISELGLSSRANNALMRREIYYAEKIAQMTKFELSRQRGIGIVSINEIIEKMQKHGFTNPTW